MRTLLVEDDVITQKLLTKMLLAHGEVRVESEAEAASVHLEEQMMAGQTYDLICLDIDLQDGDGTFVLSRVRELEEHLDRWRADQRSCVVMTTMHDSGKDILGAFKKNCDGYLVKPITKNALEAELKRLQLIER
jgi:two-component system chemotaxis response regulator CheY